MLSQKFHEKFCLWASMIAINVSVAICQVPICQFSSFGKKSSASQKFKVPVKVEFKLVEFAVCYCKWLMIGHAFWEQTFHLQSLKTS